MDNPEKMAGYTRRRGNQRWTIQRKWQGTQDEGAIIDGQSRENGSNPMLPFSLDCPSLITPSSCVPYAAIFSGLSIYPQDEGVIKDGQSRENGRVHKTKGQSKMDNPEKMAEYTRQRGNQRWTIQRKCQHRVHKTKGQSKMDNSEKIAA